MLGPELSLYHFWSCPFCDLVRRAIERLGLEVELRDIHGDPAHLQALVQATDRSTVPCLRIDGDSDESTWLHESADILKFLEDRAVEEELRARA
ncbi:MAG: glutaredoxin [Myxococcota bacterium]